MPAPKEQQILEAIKRLERKKKRVTFFISETGKDALAEWCKKNGITESGAVEEMIRTTVPSRFFKEKK